MNTVAWVFYILGLISMGAPHAATICFSIGMAIHWRFWGKFIFYVCSGMIAAKIFKSIFDGAK